MELKITSVHENLHNDLGITDERDLEIKAELKKIAGNCLELGIVTLGDSVDVSDGAIANKMSINLAKLIYETAKIARNPEELVIIVLYNNSVKRMIEGVFHDLGEMLPGEEDDD